MWEGAFQNFIFPQILTIRTKTNNKTMHYEYLLIDLKGICGQLTCKTFGFFSCYFYFLILVCFFFGGGGVKVMGAYILPMDRS